MVSPPPVLPSRQRCREPVDQKAQDVRRIALQSFHDHRHAHLQRKAHPAQAARDALGLATGARLQSSLDRQARLALVPSKYEPEDLFLHRPKVNRCLSLEQMEEAIAAAAGRSYDREDA